MFQKQMRSNAYFLQLEQEVSSFIPIVQAGWFHAHVRKRDCYSPPKTVKAQRMPPCACDLSRIIPLVQKNRLLLFFQEKRENAQNTIVQSMDRAGSAVPAADSQRIKNERGRRGGGAGHCCPAPVFSPRKKVSS